MGGSKTVIQPQSTPAPPSVAQTSADYIASLPAMYQAELDYNPKYAAQDFALAQEYSPKYADLLRTTESAAYPYTASLQEKLAKQASEGLDSQVPDAMRQQYLDTLRSEIGPNAGSGIGADYVSSNLLNLGKSWQDYYRDLGLSLTNRLPLTQASVPNARSASQGYDYGATSGYQASTYGPYAGAYANIADSANKAQTSMYNSRLGLYGAAIGGATGFLGGFTPRGRAA